MKNVSGAPGLAHLVQKCRDDKGMTFDEMTTYLRENSLNVEAEPMS